MIEVKNISVQIDKKTILKPTNFSFKKGKIYGIIGPNGAGKSTFLKVIAGFLKPSSGQVFFLGKPMLQPNPIISVVWQTPYLFQTSVYKNVAYGLKVRHINENEIRTKVREILQQFQLEHLALQKATKLSGGETAKVALARAIITSPEVLILDEPTASMDPQNVFEIEQIIQKFSKQLNMTVILVTHNMFQAKRIADETLFFHSGHLIEANQTRILFENPTHELTKKFISGETYF
ncbi:phosphate ABC transporter ATP-binding protein [Tepidibacillus fermentans]|uniref:Tungstate transport system ATP-binding protein n=1 Tax=Tepidibacillus fermentans TaxID=1281767 RepID=A0A4R3KNC5_9BACI|nr:phosphate ABC transporter ATP-binding protein [Tepidibacillus fermentans]TCS84528.1 tungstate transport system ATP-binding protein [Tepidibacillus fermentans]